MARSISNNKNVKKSNSQTDTNAVSAIGSEEEGISAEERRDILREIEAIALQERIKVQGNTFTATAKRSGAALPTVVNIIAVAIIIAAVPIFWVLFTRQQQIGISDSIRLDTDAQVAVFAELREQFDRELANIDDALTSTREQLAAVVADRSQLEQSIEEQVAARRLELETELANRLTQERARLNQLSITVAELETRLAAFEAVGRDEIEAQLATFRQDLNIRQQQVLTELDIQEQRYQEQLDESLQQRDVLVQETERSEQALIQRAEGARTQLDDLNRIQELERQTNNAIAGFYNNIINSLNRGDTDTAQRNLTLLRSYLNQELVTDLPSISQRRATDVAIISSLENLIGQLESSQGSASIIDERNQQTQASAAIYDRAQSELRTGAPIQALDSYLTIIEEYPQSRQAEDIPDELRGLFVSQNSNYEIQTEQLGGVIEQLNETIDGLNDELAEAQNTRSATETQQQDLSITIRDLQLQIGTLERQRTELETDRAALENQSALLTENNRNLSQNLEQARGTITQQAARLQNTSEQQVRVGAETEAELAQLRDVRDRYASLQGAYQAYINRLSTFEAERPALRLLEGQTALDSLFLSEDIVLETFPDLRMSVRDYFEANYDGGYSAGISEIADIMSTLVVTEAREERIAIIERERDTNDDPVVSRFMADLSRQLGP